MLIKEILVGLGLVGGLLGLGCGGVWVYIHILRRVARHPNQWFTEELEWK